MNLLSVFRPVSAALLFGCLLVPALNADEGIWTFDNPPTRQLQEKYHFTPTQQWLDHLRLSSVRLNDGGSGSFVSPHGLLLTNHHVARGQLQENSTAEHDYIRDGFYAATPAQEMKSPDLEVNVLVGMENVTSGQRRRSGREEPRRRVHQTQSRHRQYRPRIVRKNRAALGCDRALSGR